MLEAIETNNEQYVSLIYRSSLHPHWTITANGTRNKSSRIQIRYLYALSHTRSKIRKIKLKLNTVKSCLTDAFRMFIDGIMAPSPIIVLFPLFPFSNDFKGGVRYIFANMFCIVWNKEKCFFISVRKLFLFLR